jgi:hypothetical protein
VETEPTDQPVPPELLEFVKEINDTLTGVFVKHTPAIIEAYRKAGGQFPIELPKNKKEQFTVMFTLLALNKALIFSAQNNAQVVDPAMAPPSHKPVEQNSIMHYAKGAVKAAKAMTYPETEQSKARLAVCGGCDQWTGKSCKMCGCYTALKVKIPEEKCPLGKW